MIYFVKMKFFRFVLRLPFYVLSIMNDFLIVYFIYQV